jgi:hypothetical protein
MVADDLAPRTGATRIFSAAGRDAKGLEICSTVARPCPGKACTGSAAIAKAQRRFVERGIGNDM